jgi:hypothetical protein
MTKKLLGIITLTCLSTLVGAIEYAHPRLVGGKHALDVSVERGVYTSAAQVLVDGTGMDYSLSGAGKYALSFDGVNDYVQYASVTGLYSSKNKTITLRMRLFDVTTHDTDMVFFSGTSTDNKGDYCKVYNAGGAHRFIYRAWNGDTGFVQALPYISAEYVTAYFDGNFHDVVITRSDDDTVSLTIDGEQVASSSFSGATTLPADANLFRVAVAPGGGVGSSQYKGEISYVKVEVGGDVLLECPVSKGSGTTAYDVSGNGNDGTIDGATWVDLIEYTGANCLSFNGTSSGYAALGSHNITTAGSLFIRMRIDNAYGNDSYSCRVGKVFFKFNYETGISIYPEANYGTAYTVSNVDIGEWVDVLVTGSGTTVRLYVNGTDYGEKASTNGQVFDFSEASLDRLGYGAVYGKVSISRFAAWNRVVTPTEAAQIFDGGYPTSGLEMLLSCSEGSGSTLYDVSGNGSHAYKNTGATWTTADGIPSWNHQYGFTLDGAVRYPVFQEPTKSVATFDGVGYELDAPDVPSPVSDFTLEAVGTWDLVQVYGAVAQQYVGSTSRIYALHTRSNGGIRLILSESGDYDSSTFWYADNVLTPGEYCALKVVKSGTSVTLYKDDDVVEWNDNYAAPQTIYGEAVALNIDASGKRESVSMTLADGSKLFDYDFTKYTGKSTDTIVDENGETIEVPATFNGTTSVAKTDDQIPAQGADNTIEFDLKILGPCYDNYAFVIGGDDVAYTLLRLSNNQTGLNLDINYGDPTFQIDDGTPFLSSEESPKGFYDAINDGQTHRIKISNFPMTNNGTRNLWFGGGHIRPGVSGVPCEISNIKLDLGSDGTFDHEWIGDNENGFTDQIGSVDCSETDITYTSYTGNDGAITADLDEFWSKRVADPSGISVDVVNYEKSTNPPGFVHNGSEVLLKLADGIALEKSELEELPNTQLSSNNFVKAIIQ